ncbi:MAG: hypothetical protein ACLS8D_00205 [Clostridioides difficile]
MDIVRVNNITKRFNDKLALDNISFSVKKARYLDLLVQMVQVNLHL